jgi:hypothetical protein
MAMPQLALGGRKIFELAEELKRVRRLAEQLDAEMLLYLLDMAIVEASAKAGACNDNLTGPVTRLGTYSPRSLPAHTWASLVRG